MFGGVSPSVQDSSLVRDMRELLARSDGDVTVCFADDTTQAHSLILGARSPVFHAMLKTPMQEAETRKLEMQCGKDAGLAFLDFLYTGKLATTWPSSTDQVIEMSTLVDYYGVKGIDEAFCHEQSQSLRSRAKEAFPVDSESFWEDLISFLQTPKLPVVMRQSLISSLVKENLQWGRDTFLALCVADSVGAQDVVEMCINVVHLHFSTSSILTSPVQFGGAGGGGGIFGTPAAPAPIGGGIFGAPAAPAPTGGGIFGATAAPAPTGGSLFGAPAAPAANGVILFGALRQDTPPRMSPVSAKEDESKPTGFAVELAEARLADCVMRTSGISVLRNFIRLQAEVTKVMKYRTGATVEANKKLTELRFNTFQKEVHSELSRIYLTVLQISQPRAQGEFQCA